MGPVMQKACATIVRIRLDFLYAVHTLGFVDEALETEQPKSTLFQSVVFKLLDC
jgi:hypothetical protein